MVTNLVRVERFFEHKYGREEGLQEGREEGRKEGCIEEKLAIASKLLASGMEKSQALLITGLSEAEINSLPST